MSVPAPTVDIRKPPQSFDDLVDWLEGWSYRLVLLEEYPLPDLRAAVATTTRAVRAHRADFEVRIAAVVTGAGSSPLTQVVRSDHEWFELSIEQLGWFLRVVEGEDHGGHRQALGQFGRVLAEALRRHRRDERALLSTNDPRPSPTGSRSRQNTN